MTIYLTEEQYKKVLEADEASSEVIDNFLKDTENYYLHNNRQVVKNGNIEGVFK